MTKEQKAIQQIIAHLKITLAPVDYMFLKEDGLLDTQMGAEHEALIIKFILEENGLWKE